MPLESATYIDGLNASNPVGSTDKVQTLDDHVRLIKSTVKATLPNLTGAVTATHTEINYTVGVTSAIQTQLDAKAAANALNASNLTSGTVPDARFPATLPAVSGVNLTNLAATALASGTIPDARFPATLPAVSGANLTSLNGSNVASGTVADARLSSNAALYNATTITVGWRPTTPNANADEVGKLGAPQNSKSADHAIVAADVGTVIYAIDACDEITVNSGQIPVGCWVGVLNNTAGDITIIDGGASVTMYLNGTAFGSTGNRTLAPGSLAFIYHFSNTLYLVGGAGVS